MEKIMFARGFAARYFLAFSAYGLKPRDGIMSAYLKQPFFSFLLETRSVPFHLTPLAGLRPGKTKP